MCGISSATCFHGSCRAVSVAERCECDAGYAGSQCFFRGELRSFELPLAAGAIAFALALGLLLTRSVRAALTFADAPTDTFAFPREWKRGSAVLLGPEGLLDGDEGSSRRKCSPTWLWHVVGVWGGVETSKGFPWRPRRYFGQNALVTLAVLLELLPWVQSTSLAFLPVVPWPTAAKPIASILRKSLLYPLWAHLKPASFPRPEFYAALAFVPGVLVVACGVGAKRFPLFKPQPKDAPAEDLCTLLLRLYSLWAALPAMITLLLPLECFFIGYTAAGTDTSLPRADSECFTAAQIAHAAAGVAGLLLFWVVSCAVAFQLNCESSRPTPTLWTDVRYLRVDVVLRGPLAVAAVAFRNADAVALCACCVVYGVVHAVANAWMKPCAHSLITGIRTYGAVMTAWSGALGLISALLDDLGVKVTFETWSLGAIAVTALASSTLFLIHSDGCWRPRRLGAPGQPSATATASLGPAPSVKAKESGVLPPPLKQTPRRGLARLRRRVLLLE